MSKSSKKPDYPIPQTNAEGLALLWTKIRKVDLARKLGISRMAPSKWHREVPAARVDEIAKIIGVPKRHLLPEMPYWLVKRSTSIQSEDGE